MDFLFIVFLLGFCWIYLIPTTVSFIIIRKTFTLFNKLYPILSDKDFRKKELENWGDMSHVNYIQLENLIVIKRGTLVSEIAELVLKQINSDIHLLELIPVWDSSTRSNYNELYSMKDEIKPLLKDNDVFF